MIGDRIQQARKSAGLSLRALADMAGISAMAISKYENNQVHSIIRGAARILRAHWMSVSNISFEPPRLI